MCVIREELLITLRRYSTWFFLIILPIAWNGLEILKNTWNIMLQWIDVNPDVFLDISFSPFISDSLHSSARYFNLLSLFMGVIVVTREYGGGTSPSGMLLRKIHIGSTKITLAKIVVMALFCVGITFIALLIGFISQILWNYTRPFYSFPIINSLGLQMLKMLGVSFYSTFVSALVGMFVANLIRIAIASIVVGLGIDYLLSQWTVSTFLPSLAFGQSSFTAIYVEPFTSNISMWLILLSSASVIGLLFVATVLLSQQSRSLRYESQTVHVNEIKGTVNGC